MHPDSLLWFATFSFVCFLDHQMWMRTLILFSVFWKVLDAIPVLFSLSERDSLVPYQQFTIVIDVPILSIPHWHVVSYPVDSIREHDANVVGTHSFVIFEIDLILFTCN